MSHNYMDEPTIKSMLSIVTLLMLLILCVMGLVGIAVLYDNLLFIQRKGFFAMGFFFCGFAVGYSGSILFGIKD